MATACYFIFVCVTDCLQATDGALPEFIRPGGGGGDRFNSEPVQAIIPSYQFNCYGEITEWRAFVEGSGNGHFGSQPYTISFQVWRPDSTSSSYTMIGINHFPSIPLANPSVPDDTNRGIVTGVPPESERIEVQPGDVVGFYLESSRDNDDDGIQFDRDNSYTSETVWFDGSLRCSVLDPPCVYSADDFDSTTNRAPLITVTVGE